MGEKSVLKKEYILEKAREVFADKGYKEVTMKDIVEACDISRGGLYLYFDSTKALFEAVLAKEAAQTGDSFLNQVKDDATASDILTVFLKEQKKEILSKDKTLTIAIYEFYFGNRVPKRENRLRKQFESGVKVLTALIQTGVESGEFQCENPKAKARNIMYVLEGLRVAGNVFGVSEDTVDEQLVVILQELMKKN